MIDEFHVMYMYRKIQAEAATTDIKTLEQLLNKFRKVVAERREEYYHEIGEKKARKLEVSAVMHSRNYNLHDINFRCKQLKFIRLISL